jgi:hypothetical protein
MSSESVFTKAWNSRPSGRSALCFYGSSAQGLWDKGGYKGQWERGLKSDGSQHRFNILTMFPANRSVHHSNLLLAPNRVIQGGKEEV